ncbi:MAG: TonB-dependent receptor [Porphyromonadaceae bacterium]|nr:TonB-dependent receptor [Porphyromonadaceae bacterium]
MMKKLLICGMAMYLGSLQAQEIQQTDSIRHLDDLVVSAARINAPMMVSKIPAPVREIPITVNALTNAQLREMSYTDLSQVTRDMPGVNAFRDYGAFHMFLVRGFKEAIVLSDGMRDDRHAHWQSAPLTGLASIERIEVLKGASSMTVGHSALGGVINIVRKQPTNRFHSNVRLMAGSYGTVNVQAGAGGPISDRLTFRTDIEGGSSDGWRSNFSKTFNAYAALNYKISSRQSLGLILMGNKDKYGGDYGQPHLPWTVYRVSDDEIAGRMGSFASDIATSTSYSDPRDLLEHKNVSSTLKYKYKLNKGWKITNQLSYSWDDIDYYSTDGLYYLESDVPTSQHAYYYMEHGTKRYVSLSEVSRDGFAFAYDTRNIQNQLELSGKLTLGKSIHNLLAGYSLNTMKMSRFDRASYSGTGAGSVISLRNPQLYQGPVEFEFGRRQHFADIVHGWYLQDYATLGNLSILAGLRLDYFNLRTLVHKTKRKQLEAQTNDILTTNLSLTYRLGLIYTFNKYINLYASTSNYYKPQKRTLSSDVIYLNPDGTEMTPADLNRLRPQTGMQYEVGTHLTLGDRLSLNASAFYIKLNDVLATDLGAAPGGKNYGGLVGGFVSRGAELELAYTPSKRFDFSASYSYTDARISAYSPIKGIEAKNVQTGNFIHRVPLQKATAWGYYNEPLGRGILRLGFGVEFSDKAYTNETNSFELPAYTVAYALASYKVGKWTLQVNANNLFDKTYYRNAINGNQYIPAEGRNLLTTLAFDI